MIPSEPGSWYSSAVVRLALSSWCAVTVVKQISSSGRNPLPPLESNSLDRLDCSPSPFVPSSLYAFGVRDRPRILVKPHHSSVHTNTERRVGRQPDMMPTQGSTLDQIKTSLLAQLMSLVWVRSTMTLMRTMEAMQTLEYVVNS